MARPDDPRLERTRQKVLEAALAELAEAGYGGFTVDSVALRSGVARSTIYRHWADRLNWLHVAAGLALDQLDPVLVWVVANVELAARSLVSVVASAHRA